MPSSSSDSFVDNCCYKFVTLVFISFTISNFIFFCDTFFMAKKTSYFGLVTNFPEENIVQFLLLWDQVIGFSMISHTNQRKTRRKRETNDKILLITINL